MSPRWDVVLTWSWHERPAPDIGTFPGIFWNANRSLVYWVHPLFCTQYVVLASPRFSLLNSSATCVGVCAVPASCLLLLSAWFKLLSISSQVSTAPIAWCRLRGGSSDSLSYVHEQRLLYRPHTGSSQVFFTSCHSMYRYHIPGTRYAVYFVFFT